MGTTSLISAFGAIHNPWKTDYVAGGSSGGSAAAVAAGLCYATVDTDAIGSCRLPAACCGVTGFKATYGLLSTQGILEGEKADDFLLRLAHTAFMCRTAQDAAVLLHVLANPQGSQSPVKTNGRSAIGSVKHPSLGMVKHFNATDEVKTVFWHAVETFRSLGYETHDIDVLLAFPSLDLGKIDTDRQTISRSLFQEIDVLLLPTTTDETPSIEQARAAGPQAVSADNTFFCNYYGLPAISIPCGFSTKGLPLGLQIVGPRWGESIVLDVAQSFEQATPLQSKHPLLA